MKLVLHQLPSIKGPVRSAYLAPDAALALLALEKDTDGLIYTDMWRDPTASLVAFRTRRATHLPGYSPHNFGMAIDIDVAAILAKLKIDYETLLHVMKKRGWICHRRDGDGTKPDAQHFNFFGEMANFYLGRATQDPISWSLPAELAIYSKYSKDFQLENREIQALLVRLALFTGPLTGTTDIYLREAILAFQRAWGITQTGSADATTTRVLAFVTSEREQGAIPAWALPVA